MTERYSNEPMLDIYIFETSQNLEQLELLILECEKSGSYTPDAINEIFRIMHTIKGSSAIMLFNNISGLAHCVEDLFYLLRENKPEQVNDSDLSDLVLDCVDFIKVELQKIKDCNKCDGDTTDIIEKIRNFLSVLKHQNLNDFKTECRPTSGETQFYIPSKSSCGAKNHYKATITFADGCEMENLRAYSIIHNLGEISEEFHYVPSDIVENPDSSEVIKREGFRIFLRTAETYEYVNEFLNKTMLLKSLQLEMLENDEEFQPFRELENTAIEQSPIIVPKLITQEIKDTPDKEQAESHAISQSIISVSVSKLDKLMDLVGEMVISEAMVIQNPDLKGLKLDNFKKASRQLHKITSELQYMVMSIRMIPLATTFQKMHRIVRDMSKKLDKIVELELLGEETEVDKNIIEHISDPLMHLVRNAIDHGIEAAEDRIAAGKPKSGRVLLEAKNSGSDVVINIKDDGRGLDREKILRRAREGNLMVKSEQDMTDKEIYNLILLPGFSTKDNVSEFSGRGVGMDVVVKNLETIGGSVSIESEEGIGSTITLKIPLTLAIIDGMNVKVGASCYTIPTTTIKESFRAKEKDIMEDPDGNEMIMVRGECYPIIRLHKYYDIKTKITEFTKGIFIMVEQDERSLCIFADLLLGQQQVVVKALPDYIKKGWQINGLAGCTQLGDGSISLILDIVGLMDCRS